MVTLQFDHARKCIKIQGWGHPFSHLGFREAPRTRVNHNLSIVLLLSFFLFALKLLSKKGSPETFDAYGFCEAVKSLSCANRESFHPAFDRKMDLAVANSILIKPETPVVVIEGNYLLMETKPWSSLLKVFSSTVFVCPTMTTIQDRLMQRWLSLGLNPDDAMLKITSNDLVNAKLIIEKSQPPDLYLNQNYTKEVYLE